MKEGEWPASPTPGSDQISVTFEHTWEGAMSVDLGEPRRFANVDQTSDVRYFIEFLDARKTVEGERVIKDWATPRPIEDPLASDLAFLSFEHSIRSAAHSRRVIGCLPFLVTGVP